MPLVRSSMAVGEDIVSPDRKNSFQLYMHILIIHNFRWIDDIIPYDFSGIFTIILPSLVLCLY